MRTSISVCIIVVALLSACKSTGGVNDAILDYQQQVIELEKRNADLARRLDNYADVVDTSVERLEAIRRRAVNTASTVDDVIILFAEYQREVERLIRTVSEVQD